MTTTTPDLLAHVAAVRDGACDDNDLLVLADALDEAANNQPAEYEECPKCVNGWEKIRCDWCGRTPDKNGYLEHKCHCHFPDSHHFDENGGPACELASPCPRDPECTGQLNTPRPNPLRDRAELIRVQVANESEIRRSLGSGHSYADCICPSHCEDCLQSKAFARRERDLVTRNPAWLSAPCPECGGSGDSRKVRLSHSFERCPACDGEGDFLNPFYGWVDDTHFAREQRGSVTRGFLDVTLPHTLCWCRECPGCGGWASEEGDFVVCRCGYAQPTVTRPHPVLRAVLASPVGPWVRRVRAEGREPAQSWWWYRNGDGSYRGDRAYLPSPVFNCLPGRWTIVGQNGAHFDTAEAATDALARAVPIWARGAK